MGLPNMTTCFIKASKGESQYRRLASKMESTIFYNLIVKVTPQHLCYILWIRNRLQVAKAAYIPGENITQNHEYQELEITKGQLRVCSLY